ncbi:MULTISPECIES: type IV toxin-antitoxin system AbiEi family antitoxin domain-containing protein [unclassified Isoptericola]|uniref:type IV toxin-antitoxin system AbiEi family antitoxin domain-containing protein n=1 Tax=unclassified Isoptericola TaxID=2623355 RepID=UPI0027126FAD|nr:MULTISPECIES: type IV toxin-antitoxin system AbiEi family antitoxin domain-containing protein [unclassified Isoptericola]MDO8145474.1 type IV toxin-antitoxin system AbiEi family antitoxin domain-containing protein [Isoptericola sp. 178]MDO8149115.1 type IV toxin-antitoxin system AbiEi family antitoxin domain-containing protein [Isoptericola sp. b515]MDO8150940.1 type IV toxin-antitoxin system AbiEi family antitoxin domain-containing protein [Isoptericola sp. b408]
MPGPGEVLARDALRDLAEGQNGLVSRRQAVDDLGVTPGALDHLVARGGLLPVARGIYRVPYLPGVENERYQVALLRTGDPEAALSHETALALHEISDVNPARYHVTIPTARRIRRSDNDAFVVHVERLMPDQLGWWNLMRVVTATTAIEQCIAYGTPTYLLRQAIERGERTGAVRRADVARLTQLLEDRA